jgi:hypothetical protein
MEENLFDFVKEHQLNIDDFFNANGLPIGQVRDEMKSLNKLFAYNTTPCDRGNHRIRDRHSHCIVCDPKNIAFMRRSREAGAIYIAGSIKKQIIKVGSTTENVAIRIAKLNSRKVGNTSDWVALKTFACEQVTSAENKIHSVLSKYKVAGDLYGITESKELFRCSFEKANEAVETVFKEHNQKIGQVSNIVFDKSKYAFKNLVSSRS